MARRVLKAGRVTLVQKSPPIVMLPVGAEQRSLPVTSTSTSFDTTPAPAPAPRPAQRFFQNSWHRFFETKRSIWVQNVSGMQGGSGSQISLSIDREHGQRIPILLPLMREPIELTNDVSFEILRDSQEFKLIASRQPPVLRLMEEDEVYRWCEDAAPQWGLPSAEAALAKCRDTLARLRRKEPLENPLAPPIGSGLNFAPPRSQLELMNASAPNAPGATIAQAAQAAGFAAPGAPLRMDEIVSARALELCQQVSMALPEGQRRSAAWLMNELELHGMSFSLDDLEHIQAYGTYHLAKQWARKRALNLAERAGDGDDTNGVNGPGPGAGASAG